MRGSPWELMFYILSLCIDSSELLAGRLSGLRAILLILFSTGFKLTRDLVSGARFN